MSSQDPNGTSSSAAGAGDTTLALATPIPYSSDGPTLPLIDNPNLNPAALSAPTDHTKANAHAKPQTTSASHLSHKPKPNRDLIPLQNPWALLPPELLAALETRLGGSQWWNAHCIPIVYTRNQNVRSGINRLKAYLERGGGDGGLEEEVKRKIEAGDTLIAVSGMGEATIKVVGIVEMARRIVAAGDKGVTERWCLYTSLAGLAAQGKGVGGEKDEDEGGFEEKLNERKGKKVPVLTAWMSKKSIPEFKRAFGEQTFEVRGLSGEP